MKKKKKYNTNTLKAFIKREFKTKEKLPFKTTKVFYPKGSAIISPGSIEKNIYFISSGTVQASIIDKDGKEFIFSFHFATHMFSAISSYLKQVPTDFTCACISDCIIEVIPLDVLHKHLEKSTLVNKLYKYYIEFAYMARLKKERDMIMKSASERYFDLLQQEPEIIKIFPVSSIAKYLGIHPFSLSRIRKK